MMPVYPHPWNTPEFMAGDAYPAPLRTFTVSSFSEFHSALGSGFQAGDHVIFEPGTYDTSDGGGAQYFYFSAVGELDGTFENPIVFRASDLNRS